MENTWSPVSIATDSALTLCHCSIALILAGLMVGRAAVFSLQKSGNRPNSPNAASRYTK